MYQSFIDVKEDSHFPIQNLPYGIFRSKNGGSPRVGVAIGDYILDLSVIEEAGLLDIPELQGKNVFKQPSLNEFMKTNKNIWGSVRKKIQKLLSIKEPALRDNSHLRKLAFSKQEDSEMLMPVEIGDYTDFYASKEHAMNVGTLFRGKEHALLPNWLNLPVGYHGRSSSIVLSGNEIRRPLGQMKQGKDNIIFGPSLQLDFELEMGFFIGTGNERGMSISVNNAEDFVFGLVLVNDWSARDIQAWEYQPLGPFLGKNFATSISPWVIPLQALEPFRVNGPEPEVEQFPYLQQSGKGTFDIHLEVHIQGERMDSSQLICQSNYRYLYWSIAQQIAHHTVGGCNLRNGDLLASGTISGPTPNSRGSLLELTWGGNKPIRLDNGEQRTWLENGDEISITAWCQGDGFRIGFGKVTGCILPSEGL
ncbi:fumarylacetoacetase [Cytobacillus firmus]|nr:fumarylacetoacetase [Cytobacillus firmus]